MQKGRPYAPVGINDDEQIFAERLRERRIKLFEREQNNSRGYFNPYSQAAIAYKLGMSAAAFCQWEAPYHRGFMSFYKRKKWARLLGMKFTVTLE